MTEIRYKVVYQSYHDHTYRDGRLVSLFAMGQALTVYRVGQWTEAPYHLRKHGYGLLVFDSVLSAIHYNGKTVGYYIYKCEVQGPIVPIPRILTQDEISYGWRRFRGRPRKSHTRMEWPNGTEMWKRVMLIEEVIQ